MPGPPPHAFLPSPTNEHVRISKAILARHERMKATSRTLLTRHLRLACGDDSCTCHDIALFVELGAKILLDPHPSRMV